MKDKSSIYDAEPENLDRLVFEILGEPEAEEDSGSAATADAFLEQLGGHIGRYKLLSILGEGGMGIVYLAEQQEPIRRKVALKVIKPGMDSKRVMARFEAERQALALLDHPNIAHVHDAGKTESGRPYFVMEHVKGLPINEHCDHHKLNIERRLRLFQQVCQAVQHAHQKGIIHRDIKPSNILVSTQDDQAVPKIIDFGVAKALAQPLTERTLATEDSQLLGTPEYMSPEQVDMATEDIDTRSDIYSLGVLLYVLLTGALPFDSDTLRTGGIEHIRQVIRETNPKTPSTRLNKLGEDAKEVAENRQTEIGTLAKHLRKELEWIPLKAMRKDRSERYRSASELADDIENYLTGLPLIAARQRTGYKVKKFVRRNSVLVGGIAALLIVLVAGVVISMFFAIRAERARFEAQAITDFFTLDVLRAISDANTYEQSVGYTLDVASEKLDQGKFEKLPLVEAFIRGELGWTYRLLGQYDKAAKHVECALQICAAHLGEGHLQTTQKMFYLGQIYADQDRWSDAYRMSSRQLQAVQRYQPTNFRAPYISLGGLFMKMGQYKEAEDCFVKKIEIVLRVKGEHVHADVARRNLSRVYYLQGRYEEAEQLCLKIRLDTGELLPMIYRAQGRYQEAEKLLKTILERLRKKAVLAERTVNARIELASLYVEQERYADANALFTEVHDIISRLPLDKHGYVRWPWYAYELAVLRTRQRRFGEAEILLREVQEILTQKLGEIAEDHPDMLKVISAFGVLRREQQRYGEAKEFLIKALEGRKTKLGKDHPSCFKSMHELAFLYKEQGDYNKAEPLLLEAAEGRRLKLSDSHPHTQESIKNLIDLYEALNKPAEADKWRGKLQSGQIRQINE